MQTGHFPFLVLNTAPQSEHATISPGFNIISYHIIYSEFKVSVCLLVKIEGLVNYNSPEPNGTIVVWFILA
jgi:hypothetical protein